MQQNKETKRKEACPPERERRWEIDVIEGAG